VPRLVEAHEAVEHALAVLGPQTGAVVIHPEDHILTDRYKGDVDAADRMAGRVVQEVDDKAA
jgi:hypothetical protein